MRLTSDGTTLFGLEGTTLYTLIPTTGAYTPLNSVPGLAATGLTSLAYAPVTVPEPSTYALAAIARRRKVRRA
ncbi:MAG: hypothetical protein WCJ40_21185 [Planctomycetota bacterium]